jgi:hypothetical protein
MPASASRSLVMEGGRPRDGDVGSVSDIFFLHALPLTLSAMPLARNDDLLKDMKIKGLVKS